MIYELLKEKKTDKILPEKNDFRLFPRYDEREIWESLPDDVKLDFKNKADELKGIQNISLPATLYLNFRRTGDRAQYESLHHPRRTNLITLTIAECIEAKGEYIDSIIDLVWSICEETSWVVPAHNNKGELPDIEYEIFVDLFSSETGAAISWVYYFLGDVIAETSPIVKRRMELEVNKRIIAPYLQYNHFWYMGLEGDRQVNNWNPWINSNVLIAFAVFGKDRDLLIRGIEKTARSTDSFIASYHSDGACDEGPGYFGAAGAALFDYLEALSDITDGGINIWDNELIKNMARYIYRVYIGEDYYVNFADGSARPGAPAKLLARVGKAIGDGNLTAFAEMLLSKTGNRGGYPVGYHSYRGIKSLFQKAYDAEDFAPPKSHWFDGTEILTARDSENTAEGMFIAAKGGHNAESHNHNDVGHFILYSNGKPVVIDVGVETYTKKTFSSERYSIWTMQSCYHNLPAVNGCDQSAGRQYSAADSRYICDGSVTELSMQLKDAYPKEAAINSYVREFIFEHGKSFTVHDKYSLNKCVKPFIFNMMCADKPVLNNTGIQLGETITMSYDDSVFTADIEEIEITDGRLKRDWKRDYLYRIRLTEKEMKKENDFTISFTGSK